MVAAQPLEQRIIVVPADRRPAVKIMVVVGHAIARTLLGCHAALMKRAGGYKGCKSRRPLPRRQREEVAHFLG